MSVKKINIAIAGATGYVGLDLVKLLSNHPKANIKYLCAQKKIGKNIQYFDKRIKKKLPKITNLKKVNWNSINILFTALPNGESQVLANTLKNKKLKIIDLSADFRLSNALLYKPLLPLLKKNIINNNNIIIDSKSGYSGAGKNLKKKFKHKNIFSSVHAYGIYKHRHTSEIDQEIKKVTKSKVKYIFVPHLIPTFRGMLTSIYLNLKPGISAKKIYKELKRYHKKNYFVKITPLNKNLGTENVLNTNFCEISVCKLKAKNKIVILSAIDNLVKGAAGQAIQNMNIIYKFNENLGLK